MKDLQSDSTNTYQMEARPRLPNENGSFNREAASSCAMYASQPQVVPRQVFIIASTKSDKKRVHHGTSGGKEANDYF